MLPFGTFTGRTHHEHCRRTGGYRPTSPYRTIIHDAPPRPAFQGGPGAARRYKIRRTISRPVWQLRPTERKRENESEDRGAPRLNKPPLSPSSNPTSFPLHGARSRRGLRIRSRQSTQKPVLPPKRSRLAWEHSPGGNRAVINHPVAKSSHVLLRASSKRASGATQQKRPGEAETGLTRRTFLRIRVPSIVSPKQPPFPQSAHPITSRKTRMSSPDPPRRREPQL